MIVTGRCMVCPHPHLVEKEIEPEPDHLDAVGIFTPVQEAEDMREGR